MKEYKRYKVRFWNDLYVQVYNVNIDIVLYDDYELMKKWWVKQGHCLECVEDMKNPSGMCVPLENGDYVILFKRKGLNYDTIVHELVHVRQFLFSAIGMYEDKQPFVPYALMEAEAYFTGAIVQEVINRVRKFITKKDIWITKAKYLK